MTFESEMYEIGRAVDIFAVEMKATLYERYKEARRRPFDTRTEKSLMADVLNRTFDEWDTDAALDDQAEVTNVALVMFLLWYANTPVVEEEEKREALCC